MNIAKLAQKLDRFQQRHRWLAFPYAVIKKYGDDQGGYQAALITYYGFLSLFPLLLVGLTVLQLLFHNDTALQQEVVRDINNYFPFIGNQLAENIHSLGKTGIGLVVALAFTLYGARGAADALRYALDNMWDVPMAKRSGFPKSVGQSFAIILAGAIGFVATALVSSFSSVLGHAVWVKVVLNIAGFAVSAGVLIFVFWVATSHRVRVRALALGAVLAAAIIQLLLTFGGILVARQLKGFDSLYGTFAIVLGLLFWIYLLAQVIVYAAEVDTVRALNLWPRSLTPEHRTEADAKARTRRIHEIAS